MSFLPRFLFGSDDKSTTKDQSKDAGTENLLQQCEDHMERLLTASQTIKHVTDTQYELIQSILDRKGQGQSSTDRSPVRNKTAKGAEQLLMEANDHEGRQLASMQDNFCLQAEIIQNSVQHFNFFFQNLRRHLPGDTNVDKIKPINPRKIQKGSKTRTEKLETEFHRQEAEISRLKQECQLRNSEISNLTTKLNEIQNELRSKNSRIEELNRQLKAKTKTKDESEQSRNSRSTSSWGFTRRKTVTAILYTPRKGDLLTMVSDEIRKMLKNQFSTIQTDITLTDCDVPADIPPNVPVIVVCINASRLGTDVSSALQGLKLNSQIAVVILHHKEIHALPNQASERVLTGQEYKSLGAMIDMAFITSRGLYPCDMNNNAVSALVDFIRKRNE